RIPRGRRLLRKLKAFLEHVALDGPCQVEPLPHGPRRGQQFVGRELELHAPDPIEPHSPRPTWRARRAMRAGKRSEAKRGERPKNTVAPGGVEPPRAASKAAALSTE